MDLLRVGHRHRKRTLVAAVLISICACLWALSLLAPAVAGPAGKKSWANQSSIIQAEIEAVQQNLGWLEQKIKRLKDFNQYVPQKLYDSVAYKKEKIKSLKALKKRMNKTKSPKVAKKASSKKKKQNALEKAVNQKIQAAGLGDWVALEKEGNILVMENRLPILFSSASAEVAKGYEPFIKNWASLLKKYDVRIIVKGYADTDPINTEQYPSNLELGAARAGAVVRRFIANGIKPGVFIISSTGEHRFESGRSRAWKNLQRHVNVYAELRMVN